MAEVQYLVTIATGGNADAEEDQQEALEALLVAKITDLTAILGGATATVMSVVKQ